MRTKSNGDDSYKVEMSILEKSIIAIICALILGSLGWLLNTTNETSTEVVRQGEELRGLRRAIETQSASTDRRVAQLEQYNNDNSSPD